ncbi:MAG: GTP-binding protein [Verrucomicrobiota bacterium]
MKLKEPIPVTVLTGFLGAGKTTLLNNLLSQAHGHKCAIIINEFGEISIDNELVVGVDEEIVELNNGCLCCRVRGDLVKSLASLFQKKKRFDYVLIETTGLAHPGPVAQTFGMPDLAGTLRLDAIVTVVDAKHLDKELADAPEAKTQIAFADVILLNKTDLVRTDELSRIESRIQRMNPLAKIHRTQRAQLDVTKIFNIKARDLTAPLSLPGLQDREENAGHAPQDRPDDHHSHEEHDESDHSAPHEHDDHFHDESVTSFYLREERPLDLKKVEAWLGDVINTLGPNIYRSKGILNIQGQPKRVVFQGVQMMFDAAPERFWNDNEKRQSRLVFIGKELDRAKIREGFEACIAPEQGLESKAG